MAKWYSDVDYFKGLQNALAEAGVLESAEEFQEYGKHPYRYDAAFESWKELNFPDPEDDNWDEFVNSITEENESDDEEEEEEEEEDD